jgi:hypothetical protein
MDFMTAAVEKEKPQLPAVVPLGDLKPIKKELAHYDEGLSKIEAEVTALVVNDKESESRAVELAGGAKTLYKTLKKAQDNLTDEANTYVKNVRNLFRPYLDRLAAAEKTSKEKTVIFAWQKRQEQDRREAEAREEARKLQEKINAEARVQKEEAERKAREAAKKLESEQDEAARAILQQTVEDETTAAQIQAPVVVVPVVAPQSTVTRTDTGSGHLRMDWDFRVVDESKVPREYMVPNETKIRQAVKKNGIRKIEGVEIFEKPSMSIRT